MRKGNEGIAVNDIFAAVWGYEQTNVNYYQVVRIAGKTMIELKEIDKEMVSDHGNYTTSVKPVVNSFKGESIKRKVQNYSRDPLVEINDVFSASLVEKVNGEYPSIVETSYY